MCLKLEWERQPNNLSSACFSLFPTKCGYTLTEGAGFFYFVFNNTSVCEWACKANRQNVACALWPYLDLTGRGGIIRDPIIPLVFFFFFPPDSCWSGVEEATSTWGCFCSKSCCLMPSIHTSLLLQGPYGRHIWKLSWMHILMRSPTSPCIERLMSACERDVGSKDW